VRGLVPPSVLLRSISDDPALKLRIAWLSCLVASILGASAIQMGAEARYVVPVSAMLMAGAFIALCIRQVKRRLGLAGEALSSGKALTLFPSTTREELPASSSEIVIAGGRIHLQRLLEEIETTVKPYPPIEVVRVDEDLLRREVAQYRLIRAMSYAFSALLAGLAVYGMITEDRGILLGVLLVLRYLMVAFVVWSIGKMIGLRRANLHSKESDLLHLSVQDKDRSESSTYRSKLH